MVFDCAAIEGVRGESKGLGNGCSLPQNTPMNPSFTLVGAAHWDIIAATGHVMQAGADVPGRVSRRPGGVAFNIALALARQGAGVAILTSIGRDQAGRDLLEVMAQAGIDCSRVTRSDSPTDCYLAIELQGEIFGAVADCTSLETAGLSILRPLHGTVIVDCNLPEEVLAAIDAPNPVYAPASPAKARRLLGALRQGQARFYANRMEAEALCGEDLPDARSAALALVARGALSATVTDGRNAAAHADASGCVTSQPAQVRPVTTTGAGDVFLAAHLIALHQGAAPQAALDLAVAAAGRHILGANA